MRFSGIQTRLSWQQQESTQGNLFVFLVRFYRGVVGNHIGSRRFCRTGVKSLLDWSSPFRVSHFVWSGLQSPAMSVNIPAYPGSNERIAVRPPSGRGLGATAGVNTSELSHVRPSHDSPPSISPGFSLLSPYTDNSPWMSSSKHQKGDLPWAGVRREERHGS